MTIKRLTVGNYKNIATTTLDLTRMIALVSANNYGKSNLLEAIRFGFDFISISPKMRQKRMHWTRGIPLSPSLAGKEYVFSVEFDDPDLKEYRFVRYGFKFAWYNDQNNGAKIIDETLETRATESVKYTSFLKRADSKYRPAKSLTGWRKLVLTDDALAIDAIGMLEDVEIAEVIKKIRAIGYQLCDSLDLDDSFSPNPIEFDFGENVVIGNEDIPRMLAMLRSKKEDLYNLFVETIYDLFPEFNNIDLQVLAVKDSDSLKKQAIMLTTSEDGKSEKSAEIPYHIRDELYRLVIESRYLNQPISMEHMSTGTKRIFWLVANAVVSEFKQINLLGVDEIETSIHPRMIRNLLESMVEILGNTSMIITSHSPYLIQYLKPDSIYVGVPNEDGVALFRKIHPKKIKYLLNTTRKLEMSIGEYLFELMSGDSDSSRVLSAYLEEN